MWTQRPLPSEIFALIFSNLTRQDLTQCLLVSSLWHAEAESWLYSNVTLNPLLQRTHSALVQILKSRKHLLHRFEWRSHDGGEVLPEDLLDILLDYQPADNDDGNNNNNTRSINSDSSFSFPSSAPSPSSASSVHAFKSGPAPPPLWSLGPNRPPLRHFSFVGSDHSGWLLDMVLFNLTTTTMTTLELDIAGCAGDPTTFVVDFERVLDTFPHLKTFSFIGPVAAAETTSAGAVGDHLIGSSSTTTTKGQHALECLTLDTRLTCRKGPSAFSFLERLGNLKRLQIRSKMSYMSFYHKSRPWTFGQILRRCCPNLESIDTWGPVVLWFFDLPILPANKAPHLLALVSDMSSSPLSELTERLQDQEVGELLQEDGKSVRSFFPNLKHLVLGLAHSLGAQDLILLGLQARFLTHVDIYQRPVDYKYVWDMYDRDAAAAAAAEDKSTTMTTEYQTDAMRSNAVVENRRLRKRWQVGSREILLFLQHCSSLCSFSLTGRCITSDDLIEGGNGDDCDGSDDKDGEIGGGTKLFIEPWACEDTLETLMIGINISTNNPMAHNHIRHHALVWKHLGRFKKLRSLSLKLSNLIPSPMYGVEGLFEGEGGGRVKETLEEIRLLPSWWKVEDRQAMVLWFASSCPRLRVLGLEHTRQRDADGWSYSSIFGEEVKRCSIRRVFVESAYA